MYIYTCICIYIYIYIYIYISTIVITSHIVYIYCLIVSCTTCLSPDYFLLILYISSSHFYVVSEVGFALWPKVLCRPPNGPPEKFRSTDNFSLRQKRFKLYAQ